MTTSATPTPTVFYLNRIKMSWVPVFLLAFSGIGLWMVVIDDTNLFERIVGLFLGVSCGYLFILALRLVCFRGPIVVIDDRGIYDWRICPETIPWHDIKDIYPGGKGLQSQIFLDVKQPKRYLKLEYGLIAYSRRLGIVMGLPPIEIPTGVLNASLEEILDAIRLHQPVAHLTT